MMSYFSNGHNVANKYCTTLSKICELESFTTAEMALNII